MKEDNLIEQFIYLQEVNRIIQGLSNKTGKPKDHIDQIWKDTEKEVITKHKYGVVDKYREIGKIVGSKLGVKNDPVDDTEDEDQS